MGTFRIVSRKELRFRKSMGKEELALFDQFKDYVSKLESKDAGIYEFSKDEDREKCRKILRRAASAVGVRIRSREENSSLVFYRKISRGARK